LGSSVNTCFNQAYGSIRLYRLALALAPSKDGAGHYRGAILHIK